ncbi:MAG: hypothetical protein ABIQ79_07050, partial [Nitrospiraceae bacterium]
VAQFTCSKSNALLARPLPAETSRCFRRLRVLTMRREGHLATVGKRLAGQNGALWTVRYSEIQILQTIATQIGPRWSASG